MKLIILAGGTGTRLWPMSRIDKPKQFYEILSTQPMIKDTYQRFAGVFSPDDIYISTNIRFRENIRKFFPGIAADHIITEPEKRDTSPAMGFVAVHLLDQYPDEPIAFIPSDHYIANTSRFLAALQAAGKKIKHTHKMVDIAITPNFPSTAVGYTQIGEKTGEDDNICFYKFLGHKEKPDYLTAKQYLESENYLWHANYYMWTPHLFLDAFKKYVPNSYSTLMDIRSAILNRKPDNKIRELYSRLEKISFDYAITEKMDPRDVLIIKGDFGWSDIGAWDVLYDRLSMKNDRDNNLIKGKTITLDTHNSLIYAPKDKLVTTIGINDMIIVDTGDALLVCPHGRAQDVKKIVSKIKEQSLDNYL